MAEVIDLFENKNPESINLLEQIFDTLDEIQDNETDETGMELFAAILSTPDEQFEVLKPVLLDSFEKTFNTTEAQLAFAQMMNINGIRLEDINASFNELSEAVDNIEEELSDTKKDFIKTVLAIFTNSLNDSVGIAKRIIQIPIELCRENAKLPTYSTKGSAAMDVYSPDDYTILPGETVVIPLGFKVAIPDGYALELQNRSGLSIKTKLRTANAPGLIDCDFHDEIGLIVENIEPPIRDIDLIEIEEKPELSILYGKPYQIFKGDRCAQLKLIEIPKVSWLEVKSLGQFDNDHGAGFGSTGTK